MGQFKCKNCGGNLKYSPHDNALSCGYCGNFENFETKNLGLQTPEYLLKDLKSHEKSGWGTKEKMATCSSCGAQLILDQSKAAENCSFCGSSNLIVDEDTIGLLEPESIIPFVISEEDAAHALKKKFKRQFLSPEEVRKKEDVKNFKPIYIPFFAYDANVSVHYTGKKGRRVRRGKETRTVYTRVSGSIRYVIDDHVACASKNLDTLLGDKLDEFDFHALMQFKKEYLAGYTAEKYSVGPDESFERIKQNQLRADARKRVLRDIGGYNSKITHMDTIYSEVKYKYMLLPVWYSEYVYKDKKHPILVNGQTGEVEGDFVLSPFKIAIITALSALGIGLVYAEENGIIDLF